MFDEETLFADIEGGIDLSGQWHAKQMAVANDTSNLRAIIGGRRSGKTTLVGGEALMVADEFPGLTVPYVGPTVGRARDVIMPQMRKFQEQGVQLTYNLGNHQIFTPNGGCVQLFGLATMSEVEKGRGGSYPALYIDECGAIVNQRLLERAVKETFGPATKDFLGIGGRGICLSGTPTYQPGTYWEKICGGNTGKSEMGASVHHMTIYDNPFFRGREELIIAAYMQENNLLRTASEIKREWDGLFCVDSDGLAYPGWSGIVLPSHMIPIGGFTVLGVDLGSDHPCAWVVIRFVLTESVIGDTVRYIHHGHILETYEESGLTVHDVAAITRMFQQTYGVQATMGDSGGGGKMTIDTINEVMGIPIEPVNKAGNKEDRIWLFDSMLRTGTMHVHDKCETLVNQLGSVPIETKSNGLRDHMRGYHDHSLDAGHYALLAARQHAIELPLPPKVGTREWHEKQNAQENQVLTGRGVAEKRLIDRAMRRQRR